MESPSTLAPLVPDRDICPAPLRPPRVSMVAIGFLMLAGLMLAGCQSSPLVERRPAPAISRTETTRVADEKPGGEDLRLVQLEVLADAPDTGVVPAAFVEPAADAPAGEVLLPPILRTRVAEPTANPGTAGVVPGATEGALDLTEPAPFPSELRLESNP
jgi:hypothetical protein